MDDDEFWRIISDIGDPDAGDDVIRERLVERLASLEPEAILEFHKEFSKRVHEAYRFDLMAVANVVNGGVSGEDYDAFVGWLIARGRRQFEAALAEPARAAQGAAQAGAKCRALWVAPALAYRQRTGKGDFDVEAAPISLVMEGERLTPDEVKRRFPSLVARFRWTPASVERPS